jgi:hypothetical protein
MAVTICLCVMVTHFLPCQNQIKSWVALPGPAMTWRTARACAAGTARAAAVQAGRQPTETETNRKSSWCDIGFSSTVITPRLAALRSTSAS